MINEIKWDVTFFSLAFLIGGIVSLIKDGFTWTAFVFAVMGGVVLVLESRTNWLKFSKNKKKGE